MSGSDKARTVHVVLCPFCSGYHRVNIKLAVVGNGKLTQEDMPPIEILFPSPSPTKCAKTGKMFKATDRDWLHLTEEEFHLRYPGTHAN